MNHPSSNEYAPFYEGYVASTKDLTLVRALEEGHDQLLHWLDALHADAWDYRYAPEKWSVRQVVEHILDGEVIFMNRALRISRGDQTPLPGFEQDDYAADAGIHPVPAASLLLRLHAWKVLAVDFFARLDEEQLARMGTANGQAVSVRALGRIMAGHLLHHTQILKERYA